MTPCLSVHALLKSYIYVIYRAYYIYIYIYNLYIYINYHISFISGKIGPEDNIRFFPVLFLCMNMIAWMDDSNLPIGGSTWLTEWKQEREEYVVFVGKPVLKELSHVHLFPLLNFT